MENNSNYINNEQNSNNNFQPTFQLEEFEQNNRMRYIWMLLIYLICFYVGVILIQIIVTFVYCSINNVDSSQLIEGSANYNEAIANRFNIVAGSWLNFLTYLSVFIPFIFLGGKILVHDLNNCKGYKGLVWKMILIGFAINFGWNYISNILIELLYVVFKIERSSSSSENQAILTQMFMFGGFPLVFTLIISVICAPYIEELVFRKSLFGLFKNPNSIAPVIISSIIFGSIHVVPAFINSYSVLVSEYQDFFVEGVGFFGKFSYLSKNAPNELKLVFSELFYLISYCGSGFILSYIYFRSRRNMVACTAIHLGNNLLSAITLIILFIITKITGMTYEELMDLINGNSDLIKVLLMK